MRKRIMTDEDRLAERRRRAYHEVGHLAMIWWHGESLHERCAYLHVDRFGGSVVWLMPDIDERSLMVLIAGPMAEFFFLRGHPVTRPIRISSEYRDPNSDSTRMRNLVKMLRGGRDDKAYQLEVQQRCRPIIEEPKMWKAISAIAEHLVIYGKITGDGAEGIFAATGSVNWFTRAKARGFAWSGAAGILLSDRVKER